MNFQDELKKNICSQEEAEKNKYDEKAEYRKLEAELKMEDIKRALINNAKSAHYSTQDGTTTITCICELPRYYLHHYTNIERNTRLICQYFDIHPRWRYEYNIFIDELKKLAKKENIKLKIVIYNKQEDEIYSFPCEFKAEFAFQLKMGYLAVYATTIIS